MTTPLEMLRHHVSGAIARGEAVAITEIPSARCKRDRYYARARFFHEHAGKCKRPNESWAQGSWRGALALASAELRGERAGLSFHWEEDRDTDSSDFSDESPAWTLWVCDLIDSDGESLAGSLSAIDFGRNGSPHGESYARVVQAELALQYFSERAR